MLCRQFARAIMVRLVVVIALLEFLTGTYGGDAECDNELCCYVSQMSRYCSSKNSLYKLMDPSSTVTAYAEKPGSLDDEKFDKKIEQPNCCKDIDDLKEQIHQLKDLLSWYKASNGKFYKVFQEWANYTTAVEKCRDKGAYLVTEGIRNSDVRTELLNLIKAGGQSLWIGLNDIREEGKWVWNDGVEANMEDIDWLMYQPDDNKGAEDCGHYWKMVGWHVNDAPCNNMMFFLCEK